MTGRSTHLLPAEAFCHEPDLVGNCLCGPAVRSTPGGHLYLHHWALDARWYPNPKKSPDNERQAP